VVGSAGTPVSQAAPVLAPTSWVRISGGAAASDAAGAELGLARTAGGVLNVVWDHGATKTSIFDTRISFAGKILGTNTVITGWSGNGGLALLELPGNTLRLFAAGLAPGSKVNGINTFTAPAAGAPWALLPNDAWGGLLGEESPYVGATLSNTGDPVTAWPGYYHVGLASGQAATSIYPDMGYAELATDQKTGAVVVAGTTISGKGGTYVKRLLPTPGPAIYLQSASDNPQSSGLSSRIGAAGVYVAWADANAETVKLTRYLGATQTVVHGPLPGGGLGGANTTDVFAAPGGRLWVTWSADRSNYIFVTRSNQAVNRFEPVQMLTLPANSTGPSPASQVEGNGSAGPLDLFIDTDIGAEQGFMYTHVRALFSLHESPTKVVLLTKGPIVALTALDAGDPVPGVSVSVDGKHLVTNTRGSASVALAPGSYTAQATAPGYLPASVSFSVPAPKFGSLLLRSRPAAMS
jgi:hypothetical protein